MINISKKPFVLNHKFFTGSLIIIYLVLLAYSIIS